MQDIESGGTENRRRHNPQRLYCQSLEALHCPTSGRPQNAPQNLSPMVLQYPPLHPNRHPAQPLGPSSLSHRSPRRRSTFPNPRWLHCCLRISRHRHIPQPSRPLPLASLEESRWALPNVAAASGCWPRAHHRQHGGFGPGRVQTALCVSVWFPPYDGDVASAADGVGWDWGGLPFSWTS